MPELEPAELRRLRKMMLIRRFEERVFQEYTKPGQHIGGFCSLASGQEAIAVGISEVFQRGRDALASHFRSHGHALALGVSPRAAMAELFGKVTGCCRGKGGSMHFFDAAAGMLGGWYVAGTQLPLGIGAAFACRYRRTGGVCFVVLGDGAVNQGTFNESLNLASLLKLPAIIVVEDNGVALATPVARHSAEPDLVRRGCGYAMPCRGLDGNDVDQVVGALAEASDRARGGGGPSFLVARTYRFRGFTMTDAMKYRTKQEIEQARLRDPIAVYEHRLQARGLIDDAAVHAMTKEVTAAVEDAVQFAVESPFPELDERFEHVTAETYPLAK